MNTKSQFGAPQAFDALVLSICFEVMYSPAVMVPYRGTSPSCMQVEIVFMGNAGLPEGTRVNELDRMVRQAVQQLTRIEEWDAVPVHPSLWRNDTV